MPFIPKLECHPNTIVCVEIHEKCTLTSLRRVVQENKGIFIVNAIRGVLRYGEAPTTLVPVRCPKVPHQIGTVVLIVALQAHVFENNVFEGPFYLVHE